MAQTPIFRSTTIASPYVDAPPDPWIDPDRAGNPGGGLGLSFLNPFSSPSPKRIVSVKADGTPVYADGTMGQPGTATPQMVGKTVTPTAPAGGAGTGVAPVVKAASSVPYGKIIDAGVSLAGTYLQGKAQGKAIDAQTQANQAAQAKQAKYQADMVARVNQTGQQQQAIFAPYTNLGAGAASTLSSRLGLPTGPAPGSTAMPASSQPSSSTPGLQPGTLGPPQPNQPVPAPGSLASLSTAQPGTPIAQIGQAAQQQQAQNQTQSGYVTMQSPDGEVAQVAQHQVAFYQSKGGQIVQAGA